MGVAADSSAGSVAAVYRGLGAVGVKASLTHRDAAATSEVKPAPAAAPEAAAPTAALAAAAAAATAAVPSVVAATRPSVASRAAACAGDIVNHCYRGTDSSGERSQ